MTEELLDNLTEDLQEETLDLESLIRDGADYRKTIIIELPNGSKGACTIRPLTSNEWNQCTNKYLKLKGNMSGIEASEIISELGIAVVYLTANNDAETFNKSNIKGSYGFVSKPYNINKLDKTLKIAIAKSKVESRM